MARKTCKLHKYLTEVLLLGLSYSKMHYNDKGQRHFLDFFNNTNWYREANELRSDTGGAWRQALNTGSFTSDTIHITTTGRPCLIVLLSYCGLFCFTNWRFVATLSRISLLVPFFPTPFVHCLSLCHSLVILSYLKLSTSRKIMTHWRLRWWLAFFSNKVFLYFI